MKKSVKNFLKLLGRDIDRINAKFERMIDEYVQSQSSKFRSKTEFKLSLEKIMSSMFQHLSEEEHEEFIIMEQAKEVKNFFSDRKPITDFILIQSFMNRYQLSELEQADVLAYVLRLNVNEVLGLKEWCVKVQGETGINYIDVCRNMVLQCEAEQRGETGLVNHIKNILAHFDFERKKEIRENAINMFETADRLTHLITADGEIIGCNNPYDYIKTNSAPNFNITGSQLRVILKASMAKHEQERQAKLAAEKLTAKKVSNMHLVSQETLVEINKSRREALQELKEYLENGRPKRFIGYEEGLHLKSLLTIAGYDENQIADIEKKISLYNESIVDALMQDAINSARVYLSHEENLIVDKIIALLSDKNAIKNAVYDKITEDYRFLEELLITLGNQKSTEIIDEEDIGLLHMCVESLNESLTEYLNSDYRRILAPKN